MKVYIVTDISKRIVGVFSAAHVAQFWIDNTEHGDLVDKTDFQIHEWDVKNNPK